MNKCETFLNYFDWLIANCKEPVIIPDEVKEFYDILRSQQDKHIDKPLFTETGFQILEYLQNSNAKSLKAKDIADGMEISSRNQLEQLSNKLMRVQGVHEIIRTSK